MKPLKDCFWEVSIEHIRAPLGDRCAWYANTAENWETTYHSCSLTFHQYKKQKIIGNYMQR